MAINFIRIIKSLILGVLLTGSINFVFAQSEQVSKEKGSLSLLQQNHEVIYTKTKNFFFDILPVNYNNLKDGTIIKNHMFLTLTNDESQYLSNINTLKREMESFLVEGGQELLDIADRTLSYEESKQISQANPRLLKLRSEYLSKKGYLSQLKVNESQANPRWLGFTQEVKTSLSKLSSIRIGNFNYASHIPQYYALNNDLYLSFFTSKEQLKEDAAIIRLTYGGASFQRLDTVSKYVKEKLIFADFTDLTIYNSLGIALSDISFLEGTFDKNKLEQIVSFDILVEDKETQSIVGKTKNYDTKRPTLPYEQIYFYTTHDKSVVELKPIIFPNDINDSQHKDFFSQLIPKDDDTITYGKPVMYGKDKVLYWYALDEKNDTKKRTYILACYYNGKSYYIDACIVVRTNVNHYNVTYLNDNKVVKQDWYDTWNERVAPQVLYEDTHVMPLIGLDADGKIICYNPFRTQITRFELADYEEEINSIH